MLMAEQKPYLLMVQPDDYLVNPREINDNVGTMICFHNQYALGDSHDYADKDDFLRHLYLKAVGDGEQGEQKYDNLLLSISRQKDTPYGSHTYNQVVDQALMREIQGKYVVLPLYLLDHSGLAMKTTSFHDPWDSGQVGWIYVSNEDVLKEFGGAEMTVDIREKAREWLCHEVAVYDAYLRGECYGFELYKNGSLEDSCWGFIGSFETVRKDIDDYLPDACRGMTEHLAEVEQPASMIKTFLRHARIQVEQAAKAHEHTSRQQVLSETR